MHIRFAIIALLTLLAACTPRPTDQRLFRAEAMAEESPTAALAALDSLDAIVAAQLPEADRRYYEFLSVKIADKAYRPHTSDTTILHVIDYESRHTSLGRYPEALYYGGRVYSDLGDFPTALRYYQDALDHLPTDPSTLNLRANIISQYGGLLDDLRLYKTAIPFIKETISIDRLLSDSINEIHDLRSLGGIYIHLGENDSAEVCLREALAKSHLMPPSFKAKSSLYLAAVKFYKGEIDSARMYIHGTVEKVNPLARNNALAYGAEIYYAANMLDSAYWCATQLISSPDSLNKKFGYKILLKPEMISKLNPDSIPAYYADYSRILNKQFNENTNQLALLQQSHYNYETHLREREKAEHSNRILIKWIITGLIVILVLIIVALWLKYRNKASLLQLRNALDNINRLEEALKASQQSKFSDIFPDFGEDETIADLRKKLRDKLYSIFVNNQDHISISPDIHQSESYQKLQEYISQGREIKETDPLWESLEDTVLKASPRFRDNLRLLLGGKFNSFDLHTSLLIKCGVSPSHMTTLLNRSKGAIVSRRESLCMRVFDKKMGTKVIDGIIRLL